MSLQTEVDQLIAPYKNLVSICMYDTDELVYSHHSHQQMPAASLIKLAILATELERNEDLSQLIKVKETPAVGGAGVLKLMAQSEWSLADLLALMISVSDNYAANAVIDHLTMQVVNQWLAVNHYQETSLQRRLMDVEAKVSGHENLTSAFEALRLFRGLMAHYPKSTQWFLNQQFRGKLPLLMDETATDVAIYNKTGEGPLIDHDVARFSKKGHYIDVAVLTQGFTNRLTAISLMAQIGQLVYRSL
ncbi:serine hydrolase [Secundilactobacillus mixtipabuli]|uniref:Beta-lactamase class A n=1 Tax=Secundilactobacillus mixtipabuli TaxID=1435342 RepID=A0A1Z5ID60_9LACO|nr:serine hydrolase [Secundilactobacillus mixtipabuli]GAW99390.1 beta-lactamase class A [Secundilactobacillus mixtipabuli]